MSDDSRLSPRPAYIYSLNHPITGEIRYVGKTFGLNGRLKTHVTRSRHDKHHSAQWIQSLLKIGLRPVINLLEECTELNWQERERFWIAKLKERCDLTNILEGGEGCATYGRLGKPWTPEQRENNRKARAGIKINQNDKNGKRKEGIRRYCDSVKKPVCQYSLDGNFIKTWACAVDAGKELKVSSSSINVCCRILHRTCKSFYWRSGKDATQLQIEVVKKLVRGEISVIQFNKNNEEIGIYESAAEAERITGICRKGICNCCKGKTKLSGGFRWTYKDNGVKYNK